MNRIKLWSILSILFISGVMFGYTGHAEASQNIDIYEQLKLREDLGFPVDEKTVERMISSNEFSQDEYGILLTEAEQIIMKEKFHMQNEVVPKLKELLQLNNIEPAGMIINQKENEMIVMVKELDKLQHIIDNEVLLSVDHTAVKYVNAQYSEKELDEFSHAIWEAADHLLAEGVEVVSTSIELKDEKVHIGVYDKTDAIEQKIIQYFSSFPIEVISVEEPKDFASPYGGEKILSERGAGCSVGYSAKSSSTYYLVTAGHCSLDNGKFLSGEDWYYKSKSNSNYLGTANDYEYRGAVDAMIIRVSSSKTNNKININGSSRSMTSSEGRNADNVGQIVCRVGFASGKAQCGELKSKNVSYRINGVQFNNLRGASITSTNGDSGGTIYADYKYIGITKGSGGGYKTTYSQIGEINSSLGISTIIR
jgi:hypothetical protein